MSPSPHSLSCLEIAFSSASTCHSGLSSQGDPAMRSCMLSLTFFDFVFRFRFRCIVHDHLMELLDDAEAPFYDLQHGTALKHLPFAHVTQEFSQVGRIGRY